MRLKLIIDFEIEIEFGQVGGRKKKGPRTEL